MATKTVRVDCGIWGSLDDADPTRPAWDLFGPPGMQSDRRWFYRLLDEPQEWRRKGRRSLGTLRWVLYFRHRTDATFFLLKNRQKTGVDRKSHFRL